ncbi:Gfo/Idh/MocA family protein [Anaerostipes faecis]|uniref:Gfo/Idh/MocA family protein n=1 Tax=Anaerostipes faecis TaxID=2880702 RepID=UPI0011DDA4E7|nr:Gfo/Idh/MocA family oxidoreductase [Anaerostipes faecis]
MSNLKWGILGCGVIANEMAQAFEKMGRKVYGVSSRTQTKTEAFAERYGVENVYGSYEEMLEDKNIDVIYIATPHSQHYENMKKAIAAGKHILCEKAITVNDHQLEEIVSLAEEKNLTVREAMTISHMPLFKELKNRIDKGAIGTVKMVQVNFGSNKGYDSTNRFFALEAAGGALLDIGGYATTFARTFMDEAPNTILTTVQYLETGVDEQSGIILKNESDQMAVICLTIRAKQPKRGVVTGDKGYIEVYEYPRASKATITNTETGVTETIEAGRTEDALVYEVEAMEGTVSGTFSDNNLEISRDVMKILSSVRTQWGMKYPFE